MRPRDTVRTKDRKARRDALHALLASIDIGEHQPATLVRLANTLDTSGDPEAAVTLLRRARVRHPDNFWIQYRLSEILWRRLGRAEEALPFLTAALALRPESIGPWNSLGAIRNDHLGDHEGASKAFQRVIRIESGHPLAHTNLGNALWARGDLEVADAAYREALRLDPEFAAAQAGLGLTLMQKGDSDGAVAEYRQAIRLDPGSASSYNNLGIALRSRGTSTGRSRRIAGRYGSTPTS